MMGIVSRWTDVDRLQPNFDNLSASLVTPVFIGELIEPFSFLHMEKVKVSVFLQQMDFVGKTKDKSSIVTIFTVLRVTHA